MSDRSHHDASRAHATDPFALDPGVVVAAKRAMRSRMRETLGTLAPSRLVEGGAAISGRVLELDEVRRARIVMGFVPMRRAGRLMEADISAVLDAVTGSGVSLVLPRGTSDGGLEACEVGGDWRAGVVETRFDGVLEPGPGARVVALADINVVIVPGLAFDAVGGRLGRGKGFYDRFLGELKRATPDSGMDSRRGAAAPRLIGVCLEEQLVGRVDREGHDVVMDCVVTDVRTMRMAPQGIEGSCDPDGGASR